MKAFENNDHNKYRAEAKARWGNTGEYKEFEEKEKNRGAAEQNALTAGMDGLMGRFALCMKEGAAPGSPDAQALVAELQGYITEHFYTCTDEILSGLGAMYVGDERFKSNIDAHGEGTAEFIRRAIEAKSGR